MLCPPRVGTRQIKRLRSCRSPTNSRSTIFWNWICINLGLVFPSTTLLFFLIYYFRRLAQVLTVLFSLEYCRRTSPYLTKLLSVYNRIRFSGKPVLRFLHRYSYAHFYFLVIPILNGLHIDSLEVIILPLIQGLKSLDTVQLR